MSDRLRTPLARALYEKIDHQRKHKNSDHKEWYDVNAKYISEIISHKFIQFNQDKETAEFLENCFAKSEWLFTQIYQGFAKSILTFFISATSANGLLDRGSMFVLSKLQFQTLLGLNEDAKMERLLDLGAGDGKVTLKFESFFNQLYATEASSTMQWRLKQKNITVLEVSEWAEQRFQYDVITCLNLLDRCDKPLTLLQQIRSKLTPTTGLLVVALVFPVKQYVEEKSDHRAAESFDIAATKIWEVQFNYFIQKIILPAGFELVRWSRVPYLCEGDFSHAFYTLNDVVFVLKPVENQLPDIKQVDGNDGI